jgi:hypothetical protein
MAVAKRKMARAFDQVLQEEVVGALLAFAQLDLQAVQSEPRLLADIVIDAGRNPIGCAGGYVHLRTSDFDLEEPWP